MELKFKHPISCCSKVKFHENIYLNAILIIGERQDSLCFYFRNGILSMVLDIILWQVLLVSFYR